jgi:hypothetical protein
VPTQWLDILRSGGKTTLGPALLRLASLAAAAERYQQAQARAKQPAPPATTSTRIIHRTQAGPQSGKARTEVSP